MLPRKYVKKPLLMKATKENNSMGQCLTPAAFNTRLLEQYIQTTHSLNDTQLNTNSAHLIYLMLIYCSNFHKLMKYLVVYVLAREFLWEVSLHKQLGRIWRVGSTEITNSISTNFITRLSNWASTIRSTGSGRYWSSWFVTRKPTLTPSYGSTETTLHKHSSDAFLIHINNS